MTSSWVRLTLLCLTGIKLMAVADAGPGGLAISPVQIYLSPSAPTAVLTLRNQGTEQARFQLTVSSWKQHPETGESLLTPTDDVLVSPPLLILAAGEERKIRIAGTTSFGATEKSYRLRVAQLQPPKNSEEGQQLRMLTTFSLPIFLSPPKATPQSRVEAVGLDGHRWSLVVNNAGNVHMQVSTISVTAFSRAGETVFERQIAGDYVLAGMAHMFRIGDAPSDCANVDRLRVEVKAKGRTSTEDLPAPPSVCAR